MNTISSRILSSNPKIIQAIVDRPAISIICCKECLSLICAISWAITDRINSSSFRSFIRSSVIIIGPPGSAKALGPSIVDLLNLISG